jgi:hypothetical protein
LREYDRTLFMLDRSEHVIASWDAAAELPGRRYRIQLDAQAEPFEATALGVAAGGGLRVRRASAAPEIVSLADARVLR